MKGRPGNIQGIYPGTQGDRGVALIIVLLVTALLIALIFEFWYGTRVSLRAAVNFRDSTRAYFLAKSGVKLVGRLLSDNSKKGKPYDNLEQREWQPVPFMMGSDVVFMVRWEDERSKININTVDSSLWPGNLLENLQVSTDVLSRIRELKKETQGGFLFVTELHKVMKDEDYKKVAQYLRVGFDSKIDLNTASEAVLSASLKGKEASLDWVITNRKNGPIQSLGGTDLNTGEYVLTSDIFKVYSYAMVGGYKKLLEAVITRTANSFTISDWNTISDWRSL